MSDDLVARLRNPDIEDWRMVFEAVDRIEALETAIEKMAIEHDQEIAEITTQCFKVINRLEAALREIADGEWLHPAGIARRALEGKA